MSKQRNTDPAKTKRVFRDAADKANQKRLEGADTDFQSALRYNEARNRTPFDFEVDGKTKSFAARTLPAPPGVRRATRIAGGPGLPAPGTIPTKVAPKVKAPIKPVKKRRNPGTFKIQPIHGGGALGPGGRTKRRR